MTNHIRNSVRAMQGYVPGEQPLDPSVIKLNTNENPYPPSSLVQEIVQSASAEELRFYPDPVCRELRKAIGELHGCEVEQVFVGNGSDEILALCLRAFVERTGKVAYFDPSYSLYPVLCDIEELEKLEIPLADDFSWSIDKSPEASLFFLTTPNAPTGFQYPRKTVESFCQSFSGVVVLDEAYVDFAQEHALTWSLKYENVIVVRTLSKSYSLAGIRLGYAVGPAGLIDALMKIKDSYNVNRLTQNIARAAIRDQASMKVNIGRVVMTRKRVGDALKERGFEVIPSEANFLLVKPPGMSAESLYNLLRNGKILVRHLNDPRTKDYLRITMGRDEDMDILLDALDGLKI